MKGKQWHKVCCCEKHFHIAKNISIHIDLYMDAVAHLKKNTVWL